MEKLGNLTIILSSYSCNKNCPFCIAKNNKKFGSMEDDFDALEKQLEVLRKNNIRFERFVLSGNGEPSLYNLEKLQECARIIKQNEDLFDRLRVHSSGNIFLEKEKFELFNNLVSDVEFDILRIAIDPKKDMKVLGYNQDYTKAESFKKAKRIKMDIGLTKELETNTFPQELERVLQEHPNIGLIRFKDLMSGEDEQSKQAIWVRENRMNKKEFLDFTNNLLSYYGIQKLKDLKSKNGVNIVLENTGNYTRDVVYNGGLIRDYKENPIDISILQIMATRVDNDRGLIYYGTDR